MSLLRACMHHEEGARGSKREHARLHTLNNFKLLSGITPMLRIIQRIGHDPSHPPGSLVFCNRKEEDMLLVNELAELPESRLRTLHILSAPSDKVGYPWAELCIARPPLPHPHPLHEPNTVDWETRPHFCRGRKVVPTRGGSPHPGSHLRPLRLLPGRSRNSSGPQVSERVRLCVSKPMYPHPRGCGRGGLDDVNP